MQLISRATFHRIAAAAALLIAACGIQSTRGQQTPVGERVATIVESVTLLEPALHVTHPEINECSGLVRHDGAFWTHNDSGDSPRLFRSETLDFSEAEVLPVPGASAVDWEEITVFDGDLLVCDIGDNLRRRDNLVLYRVRYIPGAETGNGRLETVATYPIRYPDGPHDAEAAATIGGKLHIVTKARDDSVTIVYRFDTLRDVGDLGGPGGKNVPVRVGTLDIGAGEQVTAATFDGANETLILLTYAAILRYPGNRLYGPPSTSTRILARQCEAICLDGEDLVFTNEQRDVYRIEGFARRTIEEALPPRATARLPVLAGGAADRPAEVTIDGTGAAWRDEGADLALQELLAGEHLRWLLAGDRLLLYGRFRVLGKVVPTGAGSEKLGSGLLFLFGREPNRRVTGDDLQLAVTAGERGEIQAWRAQFRGEDVSFAPATFCTVRGKVHDGVFEFEAAIEADAIFERPLPDRFLFDAQGNLLHGDAEPRFSGLDVYSALRPYVWGEVTVERREK